MIKLFDKEIEKLSELLDIPAIDIKKLYAHGLLKEDVLMDYLIRDDFIRLEKTNFYQRNHIVMRLASHYDVPKQVVEKALKCRRTNADVCQQCQRPTLKRILLRNGGICDKCASEQIEM